VVCFTTCFEPLFVVKQRGTLFLIFKGVIMATFDDYTIVHARDVWERGCEKASWFILFHNAKWHGKWCIPF